MGASPGLNTGDVEPIEVPTQAQTPKTQGLFWADYGWPGVSRWTMR